jgi:hypothetical protein
MRYVAMQVLTWGTITGAIGSALLLATLEGASPRSASELPVVSLLSLPIESIQAVRARLRLVPLASPASAAASVPKLAAR